MEKISCILVILNRNRLNKTLASFNFDVARLEAIIVDGGEDQYLNYGEHSIDTYSFASIDRFFDRKDEFVWLLNGSAVDVGNAWRVAKFLIENGVPRDNIVNFIVSPHIQKEWIGNVKFIEKNPIDYFSTGISYHEAGLDLERITGLVGVNLAGSNQDLRQGLLTAQYVFEHQQSLEQNSSEHRRSIKFVLIGLTPYSFRYENLESFSVCSRNLQYLLALKNSRDDSVHGQLLRMLISDSIKKLFSETTEASADPNFKRLKRAVDTTVQSQAIINWENELSNLTKTFRAETFEKNLERLEQYIRLCLEHGAKPIGVVLPFSPIMQKKYPRDLLSMFRRTLRQFEKAYDFRVIDLFDLPLGYKHFYNLSHLNPKGARLAGILLNYELFRRQLKPVESMLTIPYNDLIELAFMLEPKKYTELMSTLFECSSARLRQKDRIKIGFVGYETAMWCGDLLYRLFERSERYEPTVFMCLRQDHASDPIVIEDHRRGVEQLRSRGINVVDVESEATPIERQDVLICLTRYIETFTPPLRFTNLTPETLLIYVPYGPRNTYAGDKFDDPFLLTLWRHFLDAPTTREKFLERHPTREAFAKYSGLPKFDYYFEDHSDRFEWKEAQSGSTKIIWAPHWAINEGVRFSTFHLNHEFFYEYARAHPETSWVLKPHPNLFFSAVKNGVFDSDEEFEAYLARWNELPNARVVTGAYYQSIFTSSDGLILDSGAFITEYQFTRKPLLFLTRETQKFNEIISSLLERLYRADGRDFSAIEKFIDEVLIKRNDPMREARREFFDRHLNYKAINGMLASEFIFNEIDQELRR